MKNLSLLTTALLLTVFFPAYVAAGTMLHAVKLEKAPISFPVDPLALPSDALVEQPVDMSLNVMFPTRDATENDNFDIFSADDFTNGQGWVIRNFFVYSASVIDDITCTDSITWQIYGDDGGVPDGDPAGGGKAPLWELTLAPTDPQVTTGSNFLVGTFSTVRLDLADPFYLPAGSYWLVFYPTLDTTLCGFDLRHAAEAAIGHEAMVIVPSGLFGFSSVWTPVTVTPWNVIEFSDFAFRIGGEACPGAVYDPTAGTLTIPQVMVDDSDTCYEAVLNRSGEGYEFTVASAGKVDCTCPSATLTSETGILAISYLEVDGLPKTYNVELTKTVAGWIFALSKINK